MIEGWRISAETLPDEGVPVLAIRRGQVTLAERRWERPTLDDFFNPYWYWINTEEFWFEDDCASVTHWMPLPPAPSR